VRKGRITKDLIQRSEIWKSSSYGRGNEKEVITTAGIKTNARKSVGSGPIPGTEG